MSDAGDNVLQQNLPPELLDQIFELLDSQAHQYGDPSLRNCSLVCREWRQPCQTMLFRNIRLNRRKQESMSTGLELFKAHSNLAGHIKDITITVFPLNNLMYHVCQLLNLLRPGQVRSLGLYWVPLDRTDTVDWRPEQTKSAGESKLRKLLFWKSAAKDEIVESHPPLSLSQVLDRVLPTLKKLRMHWFKVDKQCHDLKALLSATPQLEHLELNQCRFRDARADFAFIYHDKPRLPKLKTLKFGTKNVTAFDLCRLVDFLVPELDWTDICKLSLLLEGRIPGCLTTIFTTRAIASTLTELTFSVNPLKLAYPPFDNCTGIKRVNFEFIPQYWADGPANPPWIIPIINSFPSPSTIQTIAIHCRIQDVVWEELDNVLSDDTAFPQLKSVYIQPFRITETTYRTIYLPGVLRAEMPRLYASKKLRDSEM